MSDLSFHESYILALCVTLAVEIVTIQIIVHIRKIHISKTRITAVAVLANAVTHPLLWYIPYLFFPAAFTAGCYAVYMTAGEILVFAVETLVYWLLLLRGRFWLSAACSALANAFSTGFGFLLWEILDYMNL